MCVRGSYLTEYVRVVFVHRKTSSAYSEVRARWAAALKMLRVRAVYIPLVVWMGMDINHETRIRQSGAQPTPPDTPIQHIYAYIYENTALNT